MLLDDYRTQRGPDDNGDRPKRVGGTTTPLPTPVPGSDVSGGGRHQGTADGGEGDSVDAFSFATPAYSGPGSPSMSFWRNPPQFKAPKFVAPDAVTMLNDPGYQFRLDQGERALQASAAGRGMLRTGGTLKDISDYGQNTASAEYQNVYNRALQTYGATYQAAKDMYSPNLLGWQTQMGYGQQDALAAFQRAWDAYTFPIQNDTQNTAIAAGLAGSVGAP